MSGKGDRPRPLSVDKDTFNNNFDRIFGKGDKDGLRKETQKETKKQRKL